MAEQQQAEDWAAYLAEQRKRIDAVMEKAIRACDHEIARLQTSFEQSDAWARLGELLERMQAIDAVVDITSRFGDWSCVWGHPLLVVPYGRGRGPTLLAAVEAAWADFEARQPADADGRA